MPDIILDPQISEAAWQDFFTRAPHYFMHHTPAYINVIKQCVPGEHHVLALYDDNRLKGIFHYFREAINSTGFVYNSLPFFGAFGGCLLSNDAGSERRKDLLLAMRSILDNDKKGISASFSLYFGEMPYRRIYEDLLGVEATDERIMQIVTLPACDGEGDISEEILAMHLCRRSVKKALRQGFTLEKREDDEAWRFLTETHAQNMQDIGGLAKTAAQINAFRHSLPTEGRSLLVASLDGKMVAALMMLYSGDYANYSIPALLHEYRPLQPMSALIHAAMCDAAHRGLRFFSFGGTRPVQDSLHRFKANWGAVDYPYAWLCCRLAVGRDMSPAELATLRHHVPNYYIYPEK